MKKKLLILICLVGLLGIAPIFSIGTTSPPSWARGTWESTTDDYTLKITYSDIVQVINGKSYSSKKIFGDRLISEETYYGGVTYYMSDFYTNKNKHITFVLAKPESIYSAFNSTFGDSSGEETSIDYVLYKL